MEGQMRKVLALVGATLVLAGPALAADLGRPPVYQAPPPLVPVFNWTGFYIGGNLGGVWENGTITDSFGPTSFSTNRSGFIGGGQIGYNWQVAPQFVLGVEWMFDGTDIRSDFGPVTVGRDFLSASERVDWLTTVAARFGYAVNNWLFYGKAGGGWVHDTATVTDAIGANVFSASIGDTRGGWLVGAGIEYGFTPNWTMRVEYDHLGLGDVTTAGPIVGDTLTLSRHFDMVTVGLNYKF
jgi:outer membrane immunogenic protein